MPITTTRNEKNLEQLIRATHGTLPDATLRTMMTATLAANPHLERSTKLTPGMIVIVPGLDAAAAATGGDLTARAAEVTLLGASLAAYREQLRASIEDGERVEKQTAKTMTSSAYKNAASKVDGVLAKELQDSPRAELDRLAARKSFVDKDLRTIERDLQQFLDKTR